MEAPLISVVMSVYNEPLDWLRQAIDSILQQTYSSFEFIIICDNPNYIEGIKVLNEYCRKDNRIRLIFNVENLGLTKSLNIGLRAVKGKYIARMDADDISLPERFEEQMQYMESHPECVVCGTRIKYIGEVKWWRRTQSDWIKIENDDIKGRLIIGSCFAHPTVMIRRMQPQIMYDEDFPRSQDYDMWVRMSKKGSFHNLPKVLLYYRVSSSQISSRSHNSYAPEIRYHLLLNMFNKGKIDVGKTREDMTPELLYAKIDQIKSNDVFTNSECINILQLIYSVQNTHRKKKFLHSLLSGDFFCFNFLDMMRYIMVTFGIREPIKLI